MAKVTKIRANDPDTEEYWLIEGATLVRRSDGSVGSVVKSLLLEVPRDLVRFSEDFEGDAAG